ncbi:MAG: hypothetical protein QOK45_2632, partial [Mycobacterium sp.]|nr:hypothetical protein [Mycobacterium sp.]
ILRGLTELHLEFDLVGDERSREEQTTEGDR